MVVEPLKTKSSRNKQWEMSTTEYSHMTWTDHAVKVLTDLALAQRSSPHATEFTDRNRVVHVGQFSPHWANKYPITKFKPQHNWTTRKRETFGNTEIQEFRIQTTKGDEQQTKKKPNNGQTIQQGHDALALSLMIKWRTSHNNRILQTCEARLHLGTSPRWPQIHYMTS